MRGAVSVELVVVLPAFLALIFGIIQGGLFFHARTVALAAAQEGVRAASSLDGTAGDGATAAAQFLSKAGGDAALSDSTVAPQRTPTEATVTVSGFAPSVLPGWTGPRVVQTATSPVERFTGP